MALRKVWFQFVAAVYNHRALPKEEERPAMSKLLAFGYARDWEDQREQWLVVFDSR